METYTVELTKQEINTILLALSGNVVVYQSTRIKYDLEDLFHPDFEEIFAFKQDNFALQQKLTDAIEKAK